MSSIHDTALTFAKIVQLAETAKIVAIAAHYLVKRLDWHLELRCSRAPGEYRLGNRLQNAPDGLPAAAAKVAWLTR